METDKRKSLVPTTRRLVEFLRDLAQMKDKVVRDISKYEDCLWLSRLPPSLERYLNRDAGLDDVVLTIPPVRTTPAPPCPESLMPFVQTEDMLNSELEYPPYLVSTPVTILNGREATAWTAEWSKWAVEDRKLALHRHWYKVFSKFQRELDLRGDEFEVVLGIGLISVFANNFVTRHPLITLSLSVGTDPINGILNVSIQPAAKPRATDRRLLEGLDFYDSKRLPEWHRKLRDWDPVPLKEEAGGLLREWLSTGVNRAYPFSESWEPFEGIESSLRLVWAPCFILRQRDSSNLVEYFESMLKSLEGDDAVAPLGLAQLIAAIDSDERVRWLEEDGATSAEILGADPLFPLPANPEQLAIIEILRHDSGVVVQGPPGTGKTHTIANLVSALLSQGQRVLVTSQKPQALRVLREKMPKDIQSLCVSMTDVARGGSKELNESVTSLSDKFNHFSREIHEKRVKSLQNRRHNLRRSISELKEEIRALRESETYHHPEVSAGFLGTRAEIAEKVARLEFEYSWFPLPLAADASNTLPVETGEIHELLGLLRSETERRVGRATQVLPSLKELPSPAIIESLISKESIAQEVALSERTPWSSAFEKLTREYRNELKTSLNEVRLLTVKIQTRENYEWLERSLSDTFEQVNLSLWRQVATDLSVLSEVRDQVGKLGLTQVYRPELETSGSTGLSHWLEQVKSFKEYLDRGGSFKKGPLRSGSQRRVSEYLIKCQVGGLPIRTVESVGHLLTYMSADSLTRQVVERLKDVGIRIPDISRLVPRVNELNSVQELISVVVKIGEILGNVRDLLLARNVTICPQSIDELVVAIDGLEACEFMDELDSVRLELNKYREASGLLAALPHSAPEIRRLERAIERREIGQYTTAFSELALSFTEKEEQQRCDELLARLRNCHGALAELLRTSAQDKNWILRVSSIPNAWAWAAAARFLEQFENIDLENIAQDKLRASVDDLGDATAKLAAELAWGKCLTLMTAEQERALRTYQSNISSKGKGAGKWAGRYARAARQAMSEARDAVPAWIMPLNEVIETIPPDQNSFDVVIVDEASQAGIEALFLLWLAPRIIVVGDERQCAPSEIVRGGLQQIFDRLDEFLSDVPEYLRLGFTPKSNLFSLLSTRFGSVIRLREHFRSMPEIIGWSSTQFYSDAPLIPLRQFGSDRLRPLMATHVNGAYTDGSSSTLTNRVEAEAIVSQLKLCLVDPAYDDKTFGVIALQSAAQVRLLDDLIDVAIPADVRERRRLRVGTAPDFQGDERNVIFISMVVAERARITSMTQRGWQRRFNVAATRAEDQMWLFHSVSYDMLRPQDLRKSLLGYVLSPPQVFGGDQHLDLRWDSERRAPFGSKFEQRVFIKIRERGYYLTPQFEVNGRFIDLVVSGAKGRLAIECDGDYWHSSREDQMADIDRELELVRAGWRFFRIKESTFNRNPDRSLELLWSELELRGIRPGDLHGQESDSDGNWISQNLEIEEGFDGIEELESQIGEPQYSMSTPVPVPASESKSIHNRNSQTSPIERDKRPRERKVTREATISILDMSGRSFSVGDKVEHAKFGKGIIISVVVGPYEVGQARTNSAEVLFEDKSTHQIALYMGTFLNWIG